MGKKHPKTQYEQPDTGTYQTGYTGRPPKGSSVLVAVLLVLTIFLGGIASALGLINIRLLQMLQQPEVPVDIQTNPTEATVGSSLEVDETPAPQIPTQRETRLDLAESTDRESLSTAAIQEKNVRSMVTVLCYDQHNKQSATGIGVVISDDGYILTNAHVIHSAERIYVTVHEGFNYRAALVGTDVLTDLALLYIEASDLTAAEFADSDTLQDADTITSPAALPAQDYTVFTGGAVVSTQKEVSLGDFQLHLIQTNVGSCDGPLFNQHGQIVGFNSGHVPGYFGLYVKSNQGYAIPSTLLRGVVNKLLQYRVVAGRPTLGVEATAISKVYQQYLELPGGLQLLQVNYYAQRMGLLQGDILLALDGQRLHTIDDMNRILLAGKLGQQLTAVVYRDGKNITLTLTIMDVAL